MDNAFEHQLHTFPSGLRLVTVPMPAATTATVLVLVGCGSKYEPKQLSGISHFLEHMMFKGTTKRPGYLDISRELDGIGASYNAFTSKEVTGYYAKAAATKLDTILDVVFDIFLNSKLEQGAMEIERGPIIEELRMRRDDPQQHIERVFEELLYGDQPAGWEIGGTIETVSTMMSPDLRTWFDAHYVASDTVIAVAGGIDPERVKAKVSAAFERIRTAEKPHKSAVTESQTAPALRIIPKDVEQLYVSLGVRAFDMFDERRYPLALMAQILGGGMSSRLFDEVRSKRGLAYYIWASSQLYTDSGYFEVGVGLNPAKGAEGLSVVLGELAKVAVAGVTDEELRRVKDQAEGRMAFALESTNGTADDYGSSLLFHGHVITPEEELAKIMAVTKDQIRDVAAGLFHDERLNLAVIGPKTEPEQFRDILTFPRS
ncbi:MAG TPA: pitrilysin family protein [Candidatus Paceibacterota bacterium]|nr:pitrilysin family protein [Candidatus Paceibacterota bacterium]